MGGEQRSKKMGESGASIEGRKCEERAEVEIVVAEENGRERRKK